MTVSAMTAFAGADIYYTIDSPNGLWANGNNYTDPGNLMPAGLYYQVYWSLDNVYAGGDTGVDATTAGLGAGSYAGTFGDWIIVSGSTTQPGGFILSGPGGPFINGDADVGGTPPNIRDGYIYVYCYDSGSPVDGSAYFRTAIYPASGLADPAAIPQPTPSGVSFGGSPQTLGVDTFTVVPEPTTFGLFAVGMLTVVAARRRRKAA
jgi:hypothetical protein